MKRNISFFLVVLILLNSDVARADSSTDKKIAQLEKTIIALQVEVEGLKALEKQALFLRSCVNREKSTNSFKVSMKLASCTIDYFKKSREAEKKKVTK
jgi:hypothetical protein